MNKDIMRTLGFNKEVDLKEAGRCTSCAKVVNRLDFEDALSEKDYHITGLCQKCQNKIYN